MSVLICDCLPAELGLPRTPKETRSDPVRSRWAQDVSPQQLEGASIRPRRLWWRGRLAAAWPAEQPSRCQVSTVLCIVFLAQAGFPPPNCCFAFSLGKKTKQNHITF